MKWIKIIVILLCFTLLLFGCSRSLPEETLQYMGMAAANEDETAADEEEDLTGKALNQLTGLYIGEEAATRRPVAVMINNLHKALPQSGIGQADIIYETLAEGEITRLLAVFSELDAEKIGPVRSARHYYLDLALDHDALFVHHGGSNQAYAAIKNLKVQNLDGMKLEGTAFYRDPERKNQKGMYEHSSYTTGENILSAWEKAGFRDGKETKYMFLFYEDDYTKGDGMEATHVLLPYSSYQQSMFVYDEEHKIYERYQSGMPHIDELTGEILTFKNVIIQFATTYVIPGDSEGRRNIELVGAGEGLFITNGVAVPIHWEKSSDHSPTIWTDVSGNALVLNRGKTFICVFPEGKDVSLVQDLEESTEINN